jgi:bifunctional ADP-heptose synthase (sugar kinase/adenylyltransferase)
MLACSLKPNRTAEVIEYIDNCWHALKISFANEIKTFCNALSIDTHKAMKLSAYIRSSTFFRHILSRVRLISALPGGHAVVRFDEDTPLSLLRAVWPDVLVAEITRGSYGWQ